MLSYYAIANQPDGRCLSWAALLGHIRSVWHVMAQHIPHKLDIAGRTFLTGKHHTRIPVTVDLNGGSVDLHVHAIVGSQPGPTMTIVSTLHGVEWFSIEMLMRMRDRLDPNNLRGALILIPVGNPSALGAMTRGTPDNSDGADMNRVFPGPNSWIAEQMAAAIVKNVLPVTNALIDHHLGTWGSAFGYVLYGKDFPDPEVVAASKKLALAFNQPLVQVANLVSEAPGPGSLAGYAATEFGIPSCISEIGGAGFGTDIEEGWLEETVAGMFNAMRAIDMLDGPLPASRAYLSFETWTRVNPRFGGLFYPTRPNETLGREVSEGEVLGKVVSPYTFETLEELEAPFDGYLAWIARWYPVRPGDWTFGVIPKHHPFTECVEPGRS